jgi:putative peptide zinc metalloprotease protein
MVSAPAVLSVSEVIRVFAPVSSQVKRINVQMGDEVSQGQTLFVLEDSELLFQRDSLMQEIQLLKYKMSRQTSWSATAEENQISENHLKAKQAALADVEQSISMLTVNAEGPGQIVSLPAWLTAGVWVTQNDVLLELAQIRSPEIRAYVSAQHVDRIHGDRATFYTSPSNNEYPLQIASISPQSISVLTDESLAITHGGSIAVEQGSSGELIPVQDWHQLKFGATDVATINREKQGYVMFSATPRSIAASAVSRTYGMLIRESGF